MSGIALDLAAALLTAGGVAMAAVGGLGWRRRLPRNRWAGVRTVNTMRDEETFAVGNQVGAPLTMAAGAAAVLGGIAVLAAPATAVAVTLLVLTALGTLALTVAGGVLGDRAAGRVPMPTLNGGCAGVCTGCGLVDGCAGTISDTATDDKASGSTAAQA